MRRYQYKIYDKTRTTLQSTINPDLVANEIQFSSQINGGQGQLVLVLDLPITDATFLQGDILEVRVSDESVSNELLYSGFIDEVNKVATNKEQIELKVNGIFSFLSRLMYNESSNYVLTKTDDPKNIIDDIVDLFNTEYNLLTKDTSLYGATVSYDFDYTKLNKGINELKDLSENFYWFLDSNYNLIFKELPTSATHVFTYEKDLFTLNIDEDGLDIVNKLILQWKSGTTVYQDASSQSTYGVREKYISNTNIANIASANEFGAKYIADNKDPIKKITIEINTEYLFKYFLRVNDMTDTVNDYTQTIDELFESRMIETVQPGETCKIANLDLVLPSNLLISKKVYTPDKIKLYLEKFDNFIQLIKE